MCKRLALIRERQRQQNYYYNYHYCYCSCVVICPNPGKRIHQTKTDLLAYPENENIQPLKKGRRTLSNKRPQAFLGTVGQPFIRTVGQPLTGTVGQPFAWTISQAFIGTSGKPWLVGQSFHTVSLERERERERERESFYLLPIV